MLKISVFAPQETFTDEQLRKLNFAGEVTYLEQTTNIQRELKKLAAGAEVIGYSPKILGKQSWEYLAQVLTIPSNLKGLAVDVMDVDEATTTYCTSKGIKLVTLHDYTIQGRVESAMSLIYLGGSKLLIHDRLANRRNYKPEPGKEIRGRRVGIIGAGLGTETLATLAKRNGLTVSLNTLENIRVEGIRREGLEQILTSCEYIIILLPNHDKYRGYLTKERINLIHNGATLINVSDRYVVDEKAVAEGLRKGNIGQYYFEADSYHQSPLQGIETAVKLKPFSGNTEEAEQRRIEEWITNIRGLAGKLSS